MALVRDRCPLAFAGVGAFTSLFNKLEADVRVRGKQFERVCKWFLSNDPFYKHELRRVWLWDEWPGRWGGDAGIDLVAEDRNGHLWAIQAKAYDPAYRVTKRDVDKFLAESGRAIFSYRMLIATTNLIDRIGERTIQDQEKRVTFFRLNHLQAAHVDWPASPTALRPARPRKPARPHDYQREAIKKVIKGFDSADRGQLIMACGTGKTLTALFITEKLEAARILVLVPSLSLLKQTLNVWRASCTTEFASLPVCSDDTVAKTDDDVALPHTSDLGFPVTTDPEEIATFLRHRSSPRVVFATYQSSPQIQAAFALGRVPGFDLVIADEAHRCAGPVSSDFATILDPSKISAKRRLFMTATPRYFTGRVLKAAEGADFEYASMDNKAKFGKVFHRLGFSEAISRDLLTDYQVVIVGVDDATYRDWAENGVLVTRDGVKITDARTLAGQIGLAKAMRKYDLHRVISFHSRVKRAQDFARSMPDVLAWMPTSQRPSGELWSRHASGEMPAGDRYVLLQHLGRLDDGDRGLLTNARCLAEGVDVPTLDGVAFIDPRKSEVDIVQAVGRAIRKSDDKTVGTIVIPVFIDTDADPEIALDSSAFKPIWDIIKALRAHDDELGEQLDEMRRAMGRQRGAPRLPDKVHTDIPVKVSNAFARAFEVRLVEQTTASWEFWFGLLEKFVQENGHALVQRGTTVDGYKLHTWVAHQRVLYRQQRLAPGCEERLGPLPGWSWDRHGDRWEEGFRWLLDYIRAHGHTNVTTKETFKGYRLGQWVTLQRQGYRSGKLDHERQRRLQEIPEWTWTPIDDLWETGFQHLQQYVEAEGHSRVPQTHRAADGFNLGTWVNTQRVRYRHKTLEADRIERLSEIPDWSWHARESKWEQGFQHLRKFADAHDHVTVPIDYEINGFKLRDWLTNNRAKFDKLSPERQRRLKELPGWSEAPHNAKWEEGFRRLKDYVKKYGSPNVPRAYRIDGYPLGAWVDTKRTEFRKGQLSAERQALLEEITAWRWEPKAAKWEEGFRRLEEFLKKNECSYPLGTHVCDDGYRLGAWVNQQRTNYDNGTLPLDRQKRLADLPGWRWEPRAAKWEEGFHRLLEYVDQHGDAQVEAKYTTSDGYRLGAWVAQQRYKQSRGALDSQRFARLDQLKGWEWRIGTGNWIRGRDRPQRGVS